MELKIQSKLISIAVLAFVLISSISPAVTFAEETSETAELEDAVVIETTGEMEREADVDSENVDEDDSEELIIMGNDEESEEVEEETDPGILPDHPMYALKAFSERVRLAVTFRQEQKIRLRMEFAERRLAEAERMAERNKPEVVERLMEKYQMQIDKVEERRVKLTETIIERGTENGEDIDEYMDKKTEVHERILERMKTKVSESTEIANKVENAIQNTEANRVKINQRIEERERIRIENATHATSETQTQEQTQTQQQTESQGQTETQVQAARGR